KTSQGLVAADKLLTAYFSALGDAAGAQNFTVKSGLSDFTTSVAGIPGIDKSQVQAASGLAQVIATLFTERAREKTLRDMIDNGVPHAKGVVTILADHVPHALDTT